MKEGDDGDTIVLLLSGEVSITQALTLKNKKAVSDNREKVLIKLNANLHPFFGEISLFSKYKIEKQMSPNIYATLKYKKELLLLIQVYFHIFR